MRPTTDTNTRRDLRRVSADGMAYAVMVGMGEHYIAAFALALGCGDLTAGLVASIPVLAGGFLQLATPWGVRRMGSRRRWVVACVATQALAFLPLVVGAVLGRLPTWAVFASAALYWACGMAASSAWNVWVGRIVPRSVRGNYFARRNGWVYLTILGSLVVGGLVLDAAQGRDRPLLGFACLFLLAMLARLVSSRLLAAIPDPATAEDEAALTMPRRAFLKRRPRGNGARLLIYALALVTCTMVASPYFSPYMLRQLQLSYGGYTTLIGMALLAKVLVMPLLARLARQFGLVTLLRLAWLGIVMLPVLWLVSDAFIYLSILQLLSGAVWAMHEYAIFLMIFEVISEERRVAILTAYNLGDATVKVLGAVAGALIFKLGGGGAEGYVKLFLASTALRAGCIVFLARVRGTPIPSPAHLLKPFALRPGGGGWNLPLMMRRRRGYPSGE